ncbi:retrovirus-related pol polyprotein from transposon TNT 1-94 [Tanacetum coccineum]
MYNLGVINVPCSAPNTIIETAIPNIPEHNSPTPIVQESSNSTTTNQVPPTRRSSISSTQPAWLKDFVTSKHRDFEHYPDDHVASLANVLAIPEPVFYPQEVTNPKQVYELNKSLYGLKQAFRQWNHELSKILVSLGFMQSKHDYSLFFKAQGDKFTLVLVYVDDILLTGNSTQDIYDTKVTLDMKFTIKDLGLTKYFLGIEICNTAHGTYLQ